MSDDPVSLRAATAADAPAAIALWQAAGLTRPWNDPAGDFAKAIAHPMARVLLAERSGQALGTVMIGYDGHRGWFYYLAVAPAAQRQGIGRLLVRAGEDWLAAVGCPKAMLMVRSDNAGVAAFYHRLGYEPQAVITFGRRLDDRDLPVQAATIPSRSNPVGVVSSPKRQADTVTPPRKSSCE